MKRSYVWDEKKEVFVDTGERYPEYADVLAAEAELARRQRDDALRDTHPGRYA